MHRTRVFLLAATACALTFAALPAARRGVAQTTPPRPGAQPNPTAEPPAKPDGTDAVKTITRVYDIRDLVAWVPDFTDSVTLLPGGQKLAVNGGPPSPEWGERVKTREQLIDDLATNIRNSVDPESWRDDGGSVGSIREWNGRLFITQTPENQERIRDVFARLRAGSAANVRIRAHWVLTRRSELDGLLKPVPLPDKAQRPESSGRGRAAPSGAALEAGPAALDKLRGAVHFRAETLCTNGQRVYVQATASRSVLADVVPVVEEGSVRSEPTWDLWNDGLVLDVQNVVSSDAGDALLTVRSQWAGTRPAGPPEPVRRTVTTRPTTGPAGTPIVVKATGQVEHAQSGEQQLKTTARVPLSKTVLIGGMTVDPSGRGADALVKGDKPADPADGEPPQLYLFIEVTAD